MTSPNKTTTEQFKSWLGHTLGENKIVWLKTLFFPGFSYKPQVDVIYRKYDENIHVKITQNLSRKLSRKINEKDLYWVIKKLVKPGMTCVDVGANVGGAALLLAKAVGLKGQVLAFEPSFEIFAHFIRNISLNPQFRDVIIPFRLGLGETKGTVEIVESANSPGSPFVPQEGGLIAATRVLRRETVSVVRLDDLISQLAVASIDFVKVDVDGFELPVFRGFSSTLTKNRPIVFFESHVDPARPDNLNTKNIGQVVKLLEDLNYKTYLVKGDGEFVPTSFPELGKNTLALPR